MDLTLKDLVGEHELSGVDHGILKADPLVIWSEDAATLLFILDNKTYLVTEDPSDGYRSMLGDIQEVSDAAVANKFPPVKVLARYITERSPDKGWDKGECEVLELVDTANNQVILTVGTENLNDYYPWFVAAFCPEKMACNSGVAE